MIKHTPTLITLLLISSVALQADSPRVTINGNDIRTLGNRGDVIVYKAEERADGIECSSNGREIMIKSLWVYPSAEEPVKYLPCTSSSQKTCPELSEESMKAQPCVIRMPRPELKGGSSLVLHSSSLALANQLLASSYELILGAPRSTLKFHNVEFQSRNLYFIGKDFSFFNCYLINPETVQFESAVESAPFQSVSITYKPNSGYQDHVIDGNFDGNSGETTTPFRFYGAKEIRILFNDNAFDGTGR